MSLPVHVTVVVPTGKALPDGAEQETLTPPVPPCTVGFENVTFAAWPFSATVWTLAGHVRTRDTGVGVVGEPPQAAAVSAVSITSPAVPGQDVLAIPRRTRRPYSTNVTH